MQASAPCSTTSSRKCSASGACPEPALHVGQREQHGVDGAAADRGLSWSKASAGRLHRSQRYRQRHLRGKRGLDYDLSRAELASRPWLTIRRRPWPTVRRSDDDAPTSRASATSSRCTGGCTSSARSPRRSATSRRRRASSRCSSSASGTLGGAFIWTFPVVALGQFIVALNFAEVSSPLPDRRLGVPVDEATSASSKPYAWFSGWIYLWAGALTDRRRRRDAAADADPGASTTSGSATWRPTASPTRSGSRSSRSS